MTRILIIDDDKHMRTACSRVLTRAGYSISCVETGEDGLREIQNSPDPFDVVLLDQLMPGMSGMDALEQIKTASANLPVIIITGSVTDETAAEIIQKGACDCLPKPFTPEQLRTAINKALRQ
jgi:DNA-binding NtrC family response regulator